MTARHHYVPFKRDYQRCNGVDWLVVRDSCLGGDGKKGVGVREGAFWEWGGDDGGDGPAAGEGNKGVAKW
ncbi:hypothetical protein E2C01_038447 [Portunus trituberculatus]|uniref:Uncharacterized protein n=1 Tax=Portunus trituberculatus TaxID=210409 RepID=A0A5B7FGU7_PORTR|nr:hypothetical protein [Portunus trituberculatus]